VHVRNLSAAEAQALAQEIAAGDEKKLSRVSALAAEQGRKRSLAEVYQALQK
jgi:hypothetical protein